MKEKKFGVLTIVLYVFAAIFLILGIMGFADLTSQVQQAVQLQGFSVGENFTYLISMYAESVGTYVFYVVVLFALAQIYNAAKGYSKTTGAEADDDAAESALNADEAAKENEISDGDEVTVTEITEITEITTDDGAVIEEVTETVADSDVVEVENAVEEIADRATEEEKTE